MKAILLATTVAVMSGAAAQGATFTSVPVPLDPSSELLVLMVNTCTTTADFNVEVRNAITGAVLRRSQGALAANRGTALPFSFGVEREVYHKITWECRGTTQQSPLLSYTVRDLETKVPRLVATTYGRG